MVVVITILKIVGFIVIDVSSVLKHCNAFSNVFTFQLTLAAALTLITGRHGLTRVLNNPLTAMVPRRMSLAITEVLPIDPPATARTWS